MWIITSEVHKFGKQRLHSHNESACVGGIMEQLFNLYKYIIYLTKNVKSVPFCHFHYFNKIIFLFFIQLFLDDKFSHTLKYICKSYRKNAH